MKLHFRIQIKDQKTKDFLEKIQKQDEGIYIKEGNVFRRDPESGKTEALGPLYANVPEKCKECPFLTKNASGRDSLSSPEGDLFYKGGCIVRECVEGIIREKRAYAVSHARPVTRINVNNMWSSRRG